MSEQDVGDDVIDEVSDDTTEDNDGVPMIEDFYKNKESLSKANERIVAEKAFLKKHGVKSLAELEAKFSKSDEEFVKKSDLEIDNFLRDNPHLNESRESLDKYRKDKGLTLDEAKILLEAKDKTQQNREKLKNSRVSDGVEVSQATSYSKDDLSKLSSADYDKAIERLERGDAKMV